MIQKDCCTHRIEYLLYRVKVSILSATDEKKRSKKTKKSMRHAPTVPRSGTSMRSPLQAAKRRSCGINETLAAKVPRSGTSMRSPLQAAKRRSCGVDNTRATRSAKRDLCTHATTNKSGCISPASRNRQTIVLHSYPQLRRFAACSGLRIEVPLRGTKAETL